MIKILHFYKTYYPDTSGGVEQTIHQITRATAPFGVQSEIFSLSKNPCDRTIEMYGNLIHREPISFEIASTPFAKSAFRRFKELSHGVDLVHYHYPWPFMDLVHFFTRIKKPSIVTYHSDIIRQKHLLKVYNPLKNWFLSKVDQIVATSVNYFETSPVLGEYRDKTTIIPIGLDKAIYPNPSACVLTKWQKILGARFFLFVGVLRYYKGLHILLESQKNSSFPVVIVGSGPIETELKNTAQRLQLKNIHFLGAVSDEEKVALFKLCYAVVFPSHLRSEAFGVSLLEGAMYGKPLISSEIGTGTSFINIHNQTGLVIQPNDPNALAHAMQVLWDNPALAKSMGEAAEKRYWTLFTAEQMAANYVEIYKKLIQN